MTRILPHLKPANFLFEGRGNSMEFSKVQEVDTQKMLQKHILGKDDNIFLVELGQPDPFSATKNHYQKINHLISYVER